MDHLEAGSDVSDPVDRRAETVAPLSDEAATRSSAPSTAPEVAPWPSAPVVGDPGSQQSVVPRLLSDPPGRADTIIDAGVLGDLDVRAASMRGRSHRFSMASHLGRTRQDEYCLQASGDAGWLVVVVADGVSEGPHSHIAATIAARRGCQIVAEILDDGGAPSEIDWEGSVAPRLAGYIVSEARRLMSEPQEAEPVLSARDAARLMSTTAITAVVGASPDSAGGFPYVVSVLAGDSSAWVLSHEGWRSLTTIKNEGTEIASMEVRGLPLIGSCITTSGRLLPGEAVVLMTDGLGDALGSGSGEVGEYFAVQWRRPPEPYMFAAQLDFLRRSFDDDRTAVGIWAGSHPDEQ